MENKQEKASLIIIGVMLAFVSIVIILMVTFKIIFEDSTNQATIFSGILSLFGGAGGATAAFLIARMQLNKQIDVQDKSMKLQNEEQRKIIDLQFKQQKQTMELQLEEQFKKDKAKIKMEIEVENMQGAIKLLAKLRNVLNNIENIAEEIDSFEKKDYYEKIKNENKFTEVWEKFAQEFLKSVAIVNEYIIYSFFYDDYEEFHTSIFVEPLNEIEELVREIKKNKGNIEEKYSAKIYFNLSLVISTCEKEIIKFRKEIEQKLN